MQMLSDLLHITLWELESESWHRNGDILLLCRKSYILLHLWPSSLLGSISIHGCVTGRGRQFSDHWEFWQSNRSDVQHITHLGKLEAGRNVNTIQSYLCTYRLGEWLSFLSLSTWCHSFSTNLNHPWLFGEVSTPTLVRHEVYPLVRHEQCLRIPSSWRGFRKFFFICCSLHDQGCGPFQRMTACCHL